MAHQTILVLDFGSQYTQLIARRLRELSVYSEILPFHTTAEAIAARGAAGIILSGGPASLSEPGAPRCDPALFACGVPMLGICYGMQSMAAALGGIVSAAPEREYGQATVTTRGESRLLRGLPDTLQVWASHGDLVTAPPPGFVVNGTSPNAPVAVMADSGRSLHGVLFHPEVVHTTHGTALLRNFAHDICGCAGDWTMASFVDDATARIREQVGPQGRVVCGVSGGVDSTVAALLVHRAIGDRLTCIFVDNGLLRLDEGEQVRSRFAERLSLPLVSEDASDVFLDALARVVDPERKRKIIGATFIDVFETVAGRLGRFDFLAQGTLYPDVIESVSVVGPSAAIKSHHNVGGLPERLRFRLVEPLRELFKDEVRELGRELGLEDTFVWRQPFPGPGLAVRILGEVTRERLDLLRRADAIVADEIRRGGLYRRTWQSFAVLLPVRSVGVMGDERTYEATVAIRAVDSRDGMTADWSRLPHDVLAAMSSRIVNEVSGVNRVVYDISSKPPATIEWE
ncbi:MAG: glutamine-hydrolyzing GMP synthase [Acidobacteria bacterium]|nr:glutamine-hydrolyzing GMP synthase [Acidobacteriota bacterium]